MYLNAMHFQPDWTLIPWQLSSHDLIKDLEDDPAISQVRQAVLKGQLLSLARGKDPEVNLLHCKLA